MIRDYSIVQRLNPDNVFGPVQYLHRQEVFWPEDEWFWSNARDDAWVFDSHAEAAALAKTMPYHLTDEPHTILWPFAAVCGPAPQLIQERTRRRADREAQLEAVVARHRISPADAYAELERRHLD